MIFNKKPPTLLSNFHYSSSHMSLLGELLLKRDVFGNDLKGDVIANNNNSQSTMEEDPFDVFDAPQRPYPTGTEPLPSKRQHVD